MGRGCGASRCPAHPRGTCPRTGPQTLQTQQAQHGIGKHAQLERSGKRARGGAQVRRRAACLACRMLGSGTPHGTGSRCGAGGPDSSPAVCQEQEAAAAHAPALRASALARWPPPVSLIRMSTRVLPSRLRLGAPAAGRSAHRGWACARPLPPNCGGRVWGRGRRLGGGRADAAACAQRGCMQVMLQEHGAAWPLGSSKAASAFARLRQHKQRRCRRQRRCAAPTRPTNSQRPLRRHRRRCQSAWLC